jgi:two-component system sensor histidine kinase CpxA
MHRLFWKFFLSFWFALALFALAIILAVSFYLDDIRARDNLVNPFALMQRHIHEAQAAADAQGLAGLQAWARQVDQREAVPVLVLDAGGADILGRTVSPHLQERYGRAFERPPRAGPMARERPAIRTPDGAVYRLHPDFQAVTLGRVLHRPRVVAVPLLIAALVSGLVCFLLARYLVGPIERLRRATESYAAGDLSQRVGPSLGRRRDEIADLAHAFDRMAGRLDALMRSHKQLLTDVSHELRSPLARLQAALGLVRQRGGVPSTAELDRMDREAERLNELIGQLLSLARLESGVQVPAMESMDLRDMLQTITDDARMEAAPRGRGVRLEVPDAGLVLAGDARLLHSAVENVVRNAIRYTAPGTDVVLSVQAAPDHVLLRVRDHGPGVPDALLPRLFEPFVRVGEDRDRSSGGHGLGLAIAERAVRLHGGDIWAGNEPDGGLSVWLRLPLHPVASSAGTAVTA